MRHADFIAQYDVPVVDPAAPRPTLRWARRGEGRARLIAGDLRVRLQGPRLAYIDSHFPWRRSGFRYADALALHEARPDTVFFSMYEMRDPFPAPVLPLAQFPRLAPSLGITDVYGVFLGFMAGILGLRQDRTGEPEPIQGLDLSRVLRHEGIRAHAGLYPGGGFVATEAGFADARRLVEAADRVFSWAPAVLEHVPGVTAIEPATFDTAFYAATPRDFGARPLELLFVADARPRKGLSVALGGSSTSSPTRRSICTSSVHTTPRVGTARPHGRPSTAGCSARSYASCTAAATSSSRRSAPSTRTTRPATAGSRTDFRPPLPARPSARAASSSAPTRMPTTVRCVLGSTTWRSRPPHRSSPVRSGGCSPIPRAAAELAASGARRIRERLDVRTGAATRLELMDLGPGARHGRTRAPRVAQAGGPATRSRRWQPRSAGSATKCARCVTRRSGARPHTTQSSPPCGKTSSPSASSPSTTRLPFADSSTPFGRRPSTRCRSRDPAPLVSICIPTYTNYTGLVERAIPSALAQDHENIEVVVVGDAAPPETAAAIEELGEPRVRYENLAVRGPYPEDPHRRWLVAGTGPLNRSVDLARGAWITILNDDDALRQNHASMLVAAARARRDEVVYGSFEQHAPDGSSEILGRFPPEHGQFGWQCAVHHRDIARLFRYELAAALFGEPGDWHRARRMLRAGVRFSMVDEIVFDYYPGQLWHGR